MKQNMTTTELLKKWQPVLEAEGLPQISDVARRKTVAQLLENAEEGLKTGEMNGLMEAGTGLVAAGYSQDLQGDRKGYDPILVSLVRRTMPNLVAYDICGVQPMTGPTGLIFALRPKFVDLSNPNAPALGADAFYNEADSDFTGTGTHAGTTPAVLNQASPGTYTYGTGLATIDGERLGTTAGNPFPEMGFSIDKVTVTAKTRKLKAQYTNELAQDLRAIHGLETENELSAILQGEILAELNREILRTVYVIAKPGAQHTDLSSLGTFDVSLDSNGRWAAERFRGMFFQVEREANQIAKETRRGKGNFIICSSDVASAFVMAGMLDVAPATMQTNLQVDDTGNTFVGVLNGKYRVYVDPYATTLVDGDNFFVVGYKGTNAMDAGLYYAPYQALQSYKAVDPDSFQPAMGLQTRYGVVMNPFAKGATAPSATGAPEANVNVYYRRVRVTNLAAAAAGVV